MQRLKGNEKYSEYIVQYTKHITLRRYIKIDIVLVFLLWTLKVYGLSAKTVKLLRGSINFYVRHIFQRMQCVVHTR